MKSGEYLVKSFIKSWWFENFHKELTAAALTYGVEVAAIHTTGIIIRTTFFDLHGSYNALNRLSYWVYSKKASRKGLNFDIYSVAVFEGLEDPSL